MSSTNRGAVRNEADYYVTPPWAVQDFLRAWAEDEPGLATVRRVLDPCAGGTMAEDGAPLVGMTYPEVLSRQNSCFSNWNNRVETMDLRHDSLADHKGISFLDTHPEGFDLIITNPPFNIAQDIIRHALTVVQPTGFVVMLLRLNFFGGQERAKWIAENMPQRAYVHSRRMGFNAHRQDLPPKKRRATDSIEYAHFVWRQGEQPKAAQLRVI